MDKTATTTAAFGALAALAVGVALAATTEPVTVVSSTTKELRVVVNTHEMTELDSIKNDARKTFYVVPEDAPLSVKRSLHVSIDRKGRGRGAIVPAGTPETEQRNVVTQLAP